MIIYFKYGFTNFIKTVNEKEPARNETNEILKFLVISFSTTTIFMIADNILTKEGEKYTEMLNEYKKKNGKS